MACVEARAAHAMCLGNHWSESPVQGGSKGVCRSSGVKVGVLPHYGCAVSERRRSSWWWLIMIHMPWLPSQLACRHAAFHMWQVRCCWHAMAPERLDPCLRAPLASSPFPPGLLLLLCCASLTCTCLSPKAKRTVTRFAVVAAVHEPAVLLEEVQAAGIHNLQDFVFVCSLVRQHALAKEQQGCRAMPKGLQQNVMCVL